MLPIPGLSNLKTIVPIIKYVALVGIILVGAYFYHDNQTLKATAAAEHDNALTAQRLADIQTDNMRLYAGMVADQNTKIEQLEGTYHAARNESKKINDELAAHQLAADLVAKPAPTLATVNARTRGLFDDLACASGGACVAGAAAAGPGP